MNDLDYAFNRGMSAARAGKMHEPPLNFGDVECAIYLAGFNIARGEDRHKCAGDKARIIIDEYMRGA